MRSLLRVGVGLFSVIAFAAGCGGHSLSPDGGGGHAVDEHVVLRTLPRQASLIARLIEDPGV